MAEWLGRLTGDQMESSRTNANLADGLVLVSVHKTSAADVQNH